MFLKFPSTVLGNIFIKALALIRLYLQKPIKQKKIKTIIDMNKTLCQLVFAEKELILL